MVHCAGNNHRRKFRPGRRRCLSSHRFVPAGGTTSSPLFRCLHCSCPQLLFCSPHLAFPAWSICPIKIADSAVARFILCYFLGHFYSARGGAKLVFTVVSPASPPLDKVRCGAMNHFSRVLFFCSESPRASLEAGPAAQAIHAAHLPPEQPCGAVAPAAHEVVAVHKAGRHFGCGQRSSPPPPLRWWCVRGEVPPPPPPPPPPLPKHAPT